MKTKKVYSAVIAVILSISMCIPIMPQKKVYAADGSLVVNGINAMETNTGDGWEYDSSTNKLYLDGYNGGTIDVDVDGLEIVLREGSINTITNDEGDGIISSIPQNDTGSFGAGYYALTVTGEVGPDSSKPELNINVKRYGIFSKGNLDIKNCKISGSNSLETKEYIQCEGKKLTIDNCDINVKTLQGVGIACFNEHIISNSKITVNAGMVAVHANNEDLVINNTQLNVFGKTAGLMSQFGCVKLNNVTGKIEGGTAGIYARNIDADSATEIKNCTDLTINGTHGVLSYSDIAVANSKIDFTKEQAGKIGLWAYTDDAAKYSANVIVSDNSEMSGNTSFVINAAGGYTCQDTSTVNGVIRANNNGDVLLSGSVVLDSDRKFSEVNFTVLDNAKVEIAAEKIMDISEASNAVINGTLTNKGEFKVNGEITVNNGKIYNEGVVTQNQGTALSNQGEIFSACTNVFDVSGNPITLKHKGGTATCTQQAVCTECNREYGDTDATNHGETEIINVKEATCTEEGYTGDKICKDCKAVLETGSNIEKTAHKFEKGKCMYCGAIDESYEGGTTNPLEGESTTMSESDKLKAEVIANTAIINNSQIGGWTSKGKISVKWSKIHNASGYDVFVTKCGTKFGKKPYKTVKKPYITISKVKRKILNKKRNYKIKVRAFRMVNGKKVYIANSRAIHIAGVKSVKYTNAKSVKLSVKSIVLKKGMTSKITAQVIKQNKKKKLLSKKHGPAIRYYSDNKNVATVSRSGVIKAVGKGQCSIYYIALNGKKAKLKVTVN